MPSTNTVPESAGRKKPPGGSRKGIPNKATKQLKDMILGALAGVGGEEYLMGCARDPKTAAAFLTLIGKVLPTTLQGPGPNGEHVFSRIVREVVETK